MSDANSDFLMEQYQDVANNFTALLSDFNYSDEMELLNISRLNFVLRKNLSQEFEMLYIALWYNCLKTSFPETYEAIFQQFLKNNLPQKYKSAKLQEITTRIQMYIELLGNNASTDLTPISHHLLSFLKFDEASQRTYEMKITLHLRKVYTYLFERLI
ncbi:MAG: hypothetical protein K2I05_07885 [Mailhella sp.]|nr:hypothetical protein [Mailhella sp.]